MNLANHGANAVSAALQQAVGNNLQGSAQDLLGSLSGADFKEFIKDLTATGAAAAGSFVGGLAAEQITSQLIKSLNVPGPVGNLANGVLQGFSHLSVQAGSSLGANIAAPIARAAADNVLDKIL